MSFWKLVDLNFIIRIYFYCYSNIGLHQVTVCCMKIGSSGMSNFVTLQWCHMNVMVSNINCILTVFKQPVHARKTPTVQITGILWGESTCACYINFTKGQYCRKLYHLWFHHGIFLMLQEIIFQRNHTLIDMLRKCMQWKLIRYWIFGLLLLAYPHQAKKCGWLQ